MRVFFIYLFFVIVEFVIAIKNYVIHEILFYFYLGTMYVAMEFCVNGDLRSYLRKMKRCKNNLYANAKVISPVQKSVLLKFALEVASGLSHLADRQVYPVYAGHADETNFSIQNSVSI